MTVLVATCTVVQEQCIVSVTVIMDVSFMYLRLLLVDLPVFAGEKEDVIPDFVSVQYLTST